LSFSTLGRAVAVNIEFKDTKTDDNTPLAVPIREKSISPSIPE
jgi:hypothetical protein